MNTTRRRRRLWRGKHQQHRSVELHATSPARGVRRGCLAPWSQRLPLVRECVLLLAGFSAYAKATADKGGVTKALAPLFSRCLWWCGMRRPAGDSGERTPMEIAGVRCRQLYFVREDNHAHSKHTTAMAAPPVTSTILVLVVAPLAVTIRIGTTTIASKSPTHGIALGRAKFTVHPIHLRPFGTIARGSALQ